MTEQQINEAIDKAQADMDNASKSRDRLAYIAAEAEFWRLIRLHSEVVLEIV